MRARLKRLSMSSASKSIDNCHIEFRPRKIEDYESEWVPEYLEC